MALSLEQITAAFKNEETKESRPNNYYPFWDMKDGEHCVVRFLNDTNEENPFGFMVEKFMHHLEINGERKTVPCLKMFGEDCPICNVSSAFYKDEGKDSVNGKKYWRKKQHIIQALIIEDPLPNNPETGENSVGQVRFLNFGFQLYNVIKEAFGSGELEEVPTLHKGGCDFIIKKSMVGGYAKYDVGSKFARRSTDLSEEQIAIVEQHSVDLSTLLPSNPSSDRVQAMLDADLTGGEYVESNGTTPAQSSATEVTTEVVSKVVETPAAEPKTEEFNDESQDILAMIRNRKNKSAE